jgi:hypothetical protein
MVPIREGSGRAVIEANYIALRAPEQGKFDAFGRSGSAGGGPIRRNPLLGSFGP